MTHDRAWDGRIRLFFAGDVMLGRGIDQILQHPGDPLLAEGLVTSAVDYVRLAERCHGRLPRRVPPDYVWGPLPGDLKEAGCDLRVINLETAVTTASAPLPKGINYRMHPANADVLMALPADVCTLANNHVLDWRIAGLRETLEVLEAMGIGIAGAGTDRAAAEAPLAIPLANGRRVLVLAFGTEDSGIPPDWRATSDRPGVAMLPEDTDAALSEVRRHLDPVRQPADLVVVSIHWGGNWGYDITDWHGRLAHALVDEAGVHVVFGHSSHHPKAVEVRNGGLILYGCGDLINDYEGIGGHEGFRSDLVLGYLATFDANRCLVSVDLLPYRLAGFRLTRPSREERQWIMRRMDRECARFGGQITEASPGAHRICLQTFAGKERLT